MTKDTNELILKLLLLMAFADKVYMAEEKELISRISSELGISKEKTDEIINEVEKIARSFYAGAIGYFSHNGSLDSCITLRTGLIKNNTLYVQSGGGIVADSNPLREYDEIINKSKAILNATDDAINY